MNNVHKKAMSGCLGAEPTGLNPESKKDHCVRGPSFLAVSGDPQIPQIIQGLLEGLENGVCPASRYVLQKPMRSRLYALRPVT